MKEERAQGRRMGKRQGRQPQRPWLLQVFINTPRGSKGFPDTFLLSSSLPEYSLSAESRLSRGSFEWTPEIFILSLVCNFKVKSFIISAKEWWLVFRCGGVCTGFLFSHERDGRHSGQMTYTQAVYLEDIMPGRTKKKLRPFTCVLFSQFEALEFQSS